MGIFKNTMTVSRLKWAVVLYGALFIGFGIFQVIRAFYSVSNESERDFSYEWKKSYFLYKNTYIEESYEIDSIYGPAFTSEICFYDQIFGQRNTGQIRLNLLEKKNRHIPKIFAVYYILISCLWGFAFYYLYKLVLTFYKDNVFSSRNPEFLKKLGKMLIAIGSVKWFGMLLIYLIIGFMVDGHINEAYDYDVTLDWLFLIILGNILLMFCNAFNKGIILEQEQELTI